MNHKLQYISQGSSRPEQEQHILRALQSGAGWVQVRWKGAPEQELLELCHTVKRYCTIYGAVCIINDNIWLAREIAADGVHLGLEDGSVAEAWRLLGPGRIVGGTANTLTDVYQRIAEGCSYIGLGPFTFTTTKEKLSPVLGLEGYRDICSFFSDRGKTIPPVYAIGGIGIEDIPDLMDTGIYGVALSGLLTSRPELISHINTILQ